jgi:hypothetical protein
VLLKHKGENSKLTPHGRSSYKTCAYLLFSMKERVGKIEVTGMDNMRDIEGSKEYNLQGRR